ncbi:exo-alpha-sialidase [Roseivirga sp.]|uniref:exo-alpha-sialidase n=1 Tax=Roseivirga sp. TaxID=1964215 RepID=UPI003B52405E
MKKLLTLLIALTIFSACETKPQVAVEEIQLATEHPSSLPRLFTNSEGKTYLSYVERTPERMAKLYFTSLEGEQWSDAQLIAEGDNWFVNWADFPSVIENNKHMAAHWLQKSEEGTYDYDVHVAMSANSGSQWNESFIPHTDGVPAEHGFVTMLPLDNQRTFMTWLDGRNTKGGEDHNEGGHGGAGAMTLRAAIFDANGKALEEWELDDRVCDCCQTTAAKTDEGIVVIYRDRTENEIRDMSVVRLVNGNWTKPEPLKVELWEMPACPVNGPSVTAQGNQVAVAWFMAKGGTPEVKLAFSKDGGASFGEPVVVSQANTSGRVGTTTLNNGHVIVSWLDTIGETAKVMVAEYDKTGALINKMTVAETSAARASGFPVITSNGNDIYMAWTQADEKTMIKTAKINL